MICGGAHALLPPDNARVREGILRSPSALFAQVQLTAHVLMAGAENLQPDAAACRAACTAETECTAWIYCWQVHKHLPDVPLNFHASCATGCQAWHSM